MQRQRRFYAPVYRKRHPTLLTPRDFDLSPFFEIVKFNVQKRRFDYARMRWADEPETAAAKRVSDAMAKLVLMPP